jgi:hypothetical protein
MSDSMHITGISLDGGVITTEYLIDTGEHAGEKLVTTIRPRVTAATAQDDRGPDYWETAEDSAAKEAAVGGWPEGAPKPTGVSGVRAAKTLLSWSTERPPDVHSVGDHFLTLDFRANPGAYRLFEEFARSGAMWEAFGDYADAKR